nr:MAG TPA: hypothetical protein [Caudoviricetes sp.]
MLVAKDSVVTPAIVIVSIMTDCYFAFSSGNNSNFSSFCNVISFCVFNS